jgi:hypothetical protein
MYSCRNYVSPALPELTFPTVQFDHIEELKNHNRTDFHLIARIGRTNDREARAEQQTSIDSTKNESNSDTVLGQLRVGLGLLVRGHRVPDVPRLERNLV